jgi:hypothetical protein
MRLMRLMRHMERTAENICFVGLWQDKTNILGAANGKKASYPLISLMFSVIVCTFFGFQSKNMRLMRMYEDRFIEGNYLPCITGEGLAAQKHEASMRMYEARRLL